MQTGWLSRGKGAPEKDHDEIETPSRSPGISIGGATGCERCGDLEVDAVKPTQARPASGLILNMSHLTLHSSRPSEKSSTNTFRVPDVYSIMAVCGRESESWNAGLPLAIEERL